VGGAWSVGGWGGTKQEQIQEEQNENARRPWLRQFDAWHTVAPFPFPVFLGFSSLWISLIYDIINLNMVNILPHLEHNYMSKLG